MKKSPEILTALHYKPLYPISCSEKWGKKVYKPEAYNVARAVDFQAISASDSIKPELKKF